MPSMKTGSLVTVHPKGKIKYEDYNITSTGNWETTGNCCSISGNLKEGPGYLF